jgi:hypothetical protein
LINPCKQYGQSDLNFKDISIPVKMDDIPKFEKQNDMSINIFGYEKNDKNMRNCDPDFATAFNSNFDNKALCESGVMWIIRFVTYLSRFPYLLIHYYSIIH